MSRPDREGRGSKDVAQDRPHASTTNAGTHDLPQCLVVEVNKRRRRWGDLALRLWPGREARPELMTVEALRTPDDCSGPGGDPEFLALLLRERWVERQQ